MPETSPETWDVEIEALDDAGNCQVTLRFRTKQSGVTFRTRLPPDLTDLLAATPGGTARTTRKWRRSPDGLPNEDMYFNAADLDTLREIGGRLFEALFTTPDGDSHNNELMMLRDFASKGDGYLNVRLLLKEAGTLARIPWEALYYGAENRFLATDRQTNVIRVLPPAHDQALPKPVARPIALLIVVANPWRDLDVAKEVGNVRSVIEQIKLPDGSAAFRLLDPLLDATRQTMLRRVTDETPHVVHFIGHGGFKDERGLIALHRADSPDLPDYVESDAVSGILSNDVPWLVVLNCCQSAEAARANPFGGTAQGLIQAHVPFVVAMQYPISDDAAITFSGEFYSALARGVPVDQAVSRARNAIFVMGNDIGAELMTPVLYSSGQTSEIAMAVPPPAAEAEPRVEEAELPVAAAPPPVPPAAAPRPARPRLPVIALAVAALVLALLAALAGLFLISSPGSPPPLQPKSGVPIDPGPAGSTGPDEMPLPPPSPLPPPPAHRVEGAGQAQAPSGDGPGRGPAGASDPNAGLDYSIPPDQIATPAPVPTVSPGIPVAVCAAGPYIVFFDWDKSDITSEAAGILDNAVSNYQQCSGGGIELEGSSDRSGPAAYNVGLSQRRADSVKAYLMARGLPDNLMTTQAFGESEPRVATADGVRELQNRRVQITYAPAATGTPDTREETALAAALTSEDAGDLVVEIRAVRAIAEPQEAATQRARQGGYRLQALGVAPDRIAITASPPDPARGAPGTLGMRLILPAAERLRFDPGSADVSEAGGDRLMMLGGWMREHPGYRVRLDAAETRPRLGEARQTRIGAALEANGVPREAIVVRRCGWPGREASEENDVIVSLIPPEAAPPRISCGE